MSGQQLNTIRRARLALVGSIVGACALMASAAPASAKLFKCVAHAVAVIPESRIHLRCSPGDGAIQFFAFSITHPDSSRVLSLAATAVAARRAINVNYDENDLSGSAIGCVNSNCRLIGYVEMLSD
jgi:hypothetical protein